MSTYTLKFASNTSITTFYIWYYQLICPVYSVIIIQELAYEINFPTLYDYIVHYYRNIII